MYAKNAPLVLRNQSVLINLPGEVWSTEANDKIPMTAGNHYPRFKQHRVESKQIQEV